MKAKATDGQYVLFYQSKVKTYMKSISALYTGISDKIKHYEKKGGDIDDLEILLNNVDILYSLAERLLSPNDLNVPTTKKRSFLVINPFFQNGLTSSGNLAGGAKKKTTKSKKSIALRK